ncbi:MCE family protein [Caminibacter mediatlanticus TB-2]|uniref:MCE family protein n=1 Tax=Caminibacter mediatlanticus TB-2 TaxID=391592 RepID=A0AAI9F1Z7_9BACT|nr:MlaD family protein [Caminibacter mediatlanticus]EDM24227.1 hypothetical protein CMTB2_01888 [Caminibacter mediatlanticus TB-2]QCT94874.1 MCE family protein [Caminibacter mediatlanticus TB-2]
MKTEIKVGIFVLLGIISLLIMTFQIKSFERLKENGYVLYAIVNDASGINKKSRVKLRGVNVGVVDNMKLVNNGVELKLLIKKGVKIPIGSMVAIAQDNVLGGKYLKIIPSHNKSYYKPGDTIDKYLKTASMEDVMNNINLAVDDIKVLINKLNKTLDEVTINNLKNTISNIKESSVKLNSILNVVDKKLPQILNNTNDLVVSYKETGNILKSKLPKILEKVDKLALNSNKLIYDSRELVKTLKVKIAKLADTYTKLGENVNTLVLENNSTIKQTLASAEGFFTNGSNSFKKIDNMLASINKSQILVDVSSNYMFKDDDYLTTAEISYMPNPTKSYIIGLTSRKDYSNSVTSDKSKVFISAQIAKRYENLRVRGGIIENTGGIGVDYYLDKDKVRLSSEIYDFNSENDKRGSNPHLNFKATYYYLKHIEMIAGIDNILNNKARSFFLGLGIKFKDNDLKPLLSGGATSFLK